MFKTNYYSVLCSFRSFSTLEWSMNKKEEEECTELSNIQRSLNEKMDLIDELNKANAQENRTAIDEQIYSLVRLFRQWVIRFANSKLFDQSELETILLRAINITLYLSKESESALKSQGLLDESMKAIFENKKRTMDLSFLNEQILQPEDVIPIQLHDLRIYEKLIDIYATHGYPEQVYELFETLKKHYAKEETLKSLIEKKTTINVEMIENMDKVGNEELQDKEKIKEEKNHEGIKSDSKEITNESLLQMQQEMLKKMLTTTDEELKMPIFKSIQTYHHLIDSCMEVRKIKPVIAIYHFMIKNNIKFTRKTFEKIIEAFVPHGHVAGALHFFEEMSNSNIMPTATTCSLLLECFLVAKDERFKAAYEGFMESGIEPDAKLFRKYLECLCQISGDIDLAIELLDKNINRSDYNIDIDLLNMILESCIEHGQIVKGLELYAKIMDKNYSLNSDISPNMKTFNLILKLFSSKGDKRALALFMKWQRESHYSDSIYSKFKPDTDTYNALIEMHTKNHDLESAKGIFRLMKSQNISSNVISHNLMIELLQTTSWKPKLEKEISKDKSIFHRYVSATPYASREKKHSEANMFDFMINNEEQEMEENELADDTELRDEEDDDFLGNLLDFSENEQENTFESSISADRKSVV